MTALVVILLELVAIVNVPKRPAVIIIFTDTYIFIQIFSKNTKNIYLSAASAAVEVEQSFINGLGAMWPQFDQKHWRRQCKNIKIATVDITNYCVST